MIFSYSNIDRRIVEYNVKHHLISIELNSNNRFRKHVVLDEGYLLERSEDAIVPLSKIIIDTSKSTRDDILNTYQEKPRYRFTYWNYIANWLKNSLNK